MILIILIQFFYMFQQNIHFSFCTNGNVESYKYSWYIEKIAIANKNKLNRGYYIIRVKRAKSIMLLYIGLFID